MAMDNGNGKGGQDSPGSKGSSSASAGSKSGGLGGQNSPAGKNSGGGASSTSSKSSSTGGGTGGGLNSAGNRASGAGPGASSNRATTGNNTGGGSGLGGQNSPAGMSNSSLGGSRSSSLGGQNSPAGMANASLSGGMAGGMAARSTATPGFTSQDGKTNTGNYTHAPNYGNFVSQDERSSLSDRTGLSSYNDNARRADLAQQARAAENKSMTDMSREKALGTISTAEAGKKDPYSTLSGGLVTTDLSKMSVKDAVEFAKTAWNGKIASVIGAYQMKSSTLKGVAEKMGLMDAPMTPQVQDQLAVGLMQQRADLATVDGKIDVDKFAHQLSQEWASLATTTGQSYYSANGIDKASVSYAKTRAMAADLVSSGVVAPGRSVSSITSADVSSVATQAPGLGRFNSTYMGATTPTAAAKAPRSMGQKIAAGAIDVGLGMLPGVGIAASLINGGLALTGNKTLGENVVDSFVTGTGGAGPDSGDRSGNGGLVASKDTAKETARDTSTVPGKTEEDTFESRYMAFVDPTPRPTPAERWNYNTPGYA